MRAWVLLSVLFSGSVFAAPDEKLLGKAEGYPVCPILLNQDRCLVGALSHYDHLYASRKVSHGTARPLKSAPQELAGVDEWMAANRNTGLLVLKGDTVLAERYNYDRKPTDRFQSFSMAKTVVAMLIGVAVFEHHISSIDDLAQKYLPKGPGSVLSFEIQTKGGDQRMAGKKFIEALQLDRKSVV